jgi:flagellar M-ring protein FliF
MDFLNKAYAQIVDLFRSMTPAGRLMAGLLSAAIVVALAFSFQFQTQSADGYLLEGRPFMAGELTAVQRALSEANLNNWELDGNRIKIPSGQKAVYIAALAENNALPSDWNAAMDKAVDGTNPFRSRHEIDLTLQRAKQKELGMVISRFRNVEQASVMFDEIEKPGGLRRTKHKTASVAVQTNGMGLEEAQVRAIRNLLATSYAGLNRDDIAITDTTTGNSSYGAASRNGDGSENLYATTKAGYEADWRKKISDQLANVAGVIVGVNVEMDGEIRSKTTTVKIDPKPVPITTSEKTLESTSVGPTNQGRPGAVPNGVAGATVGNQPATVAEAAGPKSTQSETSSTQNSVPGFNKTDTENVALRPQHVTAVVNVPASHYLKIWKQLNPTPAGQPAKEADVAELKKIEGEEIKRIEDTVTNLLPPLPAGKNPYPLVKVTTYVDVPATLPTATPLMTTITDWLSGNWRTIGMFVVGLVGLVMLRGMLRNNAAPLVDAQEAPASGGEQHDRETDSLDEEPSPEPILMMRRKLSSKGPNLREELRQLVKDDPDAAANVLRGWIGDAA